MGVARIYFTSFDDEKYRQVLDEIRTAAGEERVVEHPSRVVSEFRYVEVKDVDKGFVEKLEEILRKHLSKFKVDYLEP